MEIIKFRTVGIFLPPQGIFFSGKGNDRVVRRLRRRREAIRVDALRCKKEKGDFYE